MRGVEKVKMPGEDDGPRQIEIVSSPPNEPTISETKNVSEKKSTKASAAETLPTVSSKQSTTVKLVESLSMSLLDDTALHLQGLMKGLHANLPAPQIKAYDPDRVNAACNCAKQLYTLLRLKLDAIKVQLENS